MAPFVLARMHDPVLIPRRSPMAKPLFGHERSLSAHSGSSQFFDKIVVLQYTSFRSGLLFLKKRAIGYIRESKLMALDTPTMESQAKYVREYCQRMGYD